MAEQLMKHHPKKSGIEGEAKNISPIDYLGKDFADPRMKPPRFKPKFEVIIASISASSISAGDIVSGRRRVHGCISRRSELMISSRQEWPIHVGSNRAFTGPGRSSHQDIISLKGIPSKIAIKTLLDEKGFLILHNIPIQNF